MAESRPDEPAAERDRAPLTRCYDIHGVGLAVTTDDALLASLVDSRLRAFAGPDWGQGEDQARFYFRSLGRSDVPRRRPVGGRPVYDPPFGEVLYFDDEDALHINYGRISVWADLRHGRVDVGMRGADDADRWMGSHAVFTLPLLEVLKRRGLYGLHAAAASTEGRVLLLAGASGSGKSTLAIALASAGLAFLGDDTVFLRRGPGGLTVLAFPDEVDVSDTTAAMFPELRGLVGQPRLPGATKHRLRPEDMYGSPTVMAGTPVAVVFPRVADRDRSALSPVSAGEALSELVPNVLLTAPSLAQGHLDVLGALATGCPAYRLATGRDLESVGKLMIGLLEAPVAGPHRPRLRPGDLC